MKNILQIYGIPKPRLRDQGFESLLRIIVNQQLSVSSATSIWANLKNGFGTMTPEVILATPPQNLRKFGLSRQKVRYVNSLAQAVEKRSFDIKSLSTYSDDEVLGCLTKVTGIGLWTAQIYLMFALSRPDIWPNGDLALASAVKKILSLQERPHGRVLLEISERWRPWRTNAAMLLWHYYSKSL